MSTKKVLITDKVHSVLVDGLQKIGFEVIYDESIKNEELAKCIDQLEGVIINSKIKMDRTMIDRATNLKFIGRLGSGLEIIDVPYASAQNIHVINSPEGNRNAVAEHSVGMLLALMNNIVPADRDVRNMEWQRELRRGVELSGKTVGIIGFGHTGSAFASKLLNWNVELITYDKYLDHLSPKYSYVKKVTLEDLQLEADIISFNLPLTEETIHFCDSKFISGCKEGVILLNASRGQVIETEALIDNLANKKVGGACLDVFENEKPSTFSSKEQKEYQMIYDFGNTVLTPHIAGWTKESLFEIASVILEKILILYQDEV